MIEFTVRLESFSLKESTILFTFTPLNTTATPRAINLYVSPVRFSELNLMASVPLIVAALKADILSANGGLQLDWADEVEMLAVPQSGDFTSILETVFATVTLADIIAIPPPPDPLEGAEV